MPAARGWSIDSCRRTARIFPAVVRYDEPQRKWSKTRGDVTYVKTSLPCISGSALASNWTDDSYREWVSGSLAIEFRRLCISTEVLAILNGMKKYGRIVADNGLDCPAPSSSYPALKPFRRSLRKIKGSDFESSNHCRLRAKSVKL